MADLREKVLAEAALVEETLSTLRQTLARPRMERPEWMAVGGFIFNVYTGMENMLKNVCRARGVQLPSASPSSHLDLLDAALANGVVGARMRDDLDEYRAFRHFFAHGYGVVLDPEQLGPLAEKLPAVWRRFRLQMENHL